jgi:hypothetical protein
MGVTHYRGSLADLSRVEDFEDRVIDLALAVGGDCRVWRSADDRDTSRVVRGLILDLAPGQESTSLLISPEGWLVGLMEIEDAERGVLTEKPWCWVKTQFGPVEGHVALVELLTALKAEFMPELEVSDEGGYWEDRDAAKLRQNMEFLGRAIDLLAGALEHDGLSPEAAEDPEILATRIERLARKVHETLSRPAEHAPVSFPDDELGLPPDPAENEARWDELYRENRRKQERMERTMEEQMLLGVDRREALEAAIEEATLRIDEEQDNDDKMTSFAADAADADDVDEAWGEGLPSTEDACDESFEERFRHPLQLRATSLWMQLHDVAKRADERSKNVDLLMRSAGEIVGGLAQALPLPPPYELDESEAGLCLVQLKRALRGAAFVAGALFLLRADKTINEQEFRPLHDEAQAIQAEIVELLRTIREARA